MIVMVSTGCPLIPFKDIRFNGFGGTNDYSYYPQKDTFKVGDTLWLMLSFTKNLKNEKYDITFDEDSLECHWNMRLEELPK